MKKLVTYIYATLVLIAMHITSCTAANPDSVNKSSTVKADSLKNKNTLLVYLSRSNNSQSVAELIQAEVGGDLFKLELQVPYPEDYRQMRDQVVREQQQNLLPKLKTQVPNFEQYEVVFVGYPTWGMQLPPPVKSFLKAYNWKGKKLIPFNTNAGYGLGNSLETIREMATAAEIAPVFSTVGGNESEGTLQVIKNERAREVKAELRAWLKKIGY